MKWLVIAGLVALGGLIAWRASAPAPIDTSLPPQGGRIPGADQGAPMVFTDGGL